MTTGVKMNNINNGTKQQTQLFKYIYVKYMMPTREGGGGVIKVGGTNQINPVSYARGRGIPSKHVREELVRIYEFPGGVNDVRFAALLANYGFEVYAGKEWWYDTRDRTRAQVMTALSCVLDAYAFFLEKSSLILYPSDPEHTYRTAAFSDNEYSAFDEHHYLVVNRTLGTRQMIPRLLVDGVMDPNQPHQTPVISMAHRQVE